MEAAEKKYWAWKKLNPFPERPRSLASRIELQGHEDRVQCWLERAGQAEDETGFTAANELQTIACKALTQAAERLAGIRAETTELRRKARVSDLIQEWADEADKPISDSITADLLHLGAEPGAAG